MEKEIKMKLTMKLLISDKARREVIKREIPDVLVTEDGIEFEPTESNVLCLFHAGITHGWDECYINLLNSYKKYNGKRNS